MNQFYFSKPEKFNDPFDFNTDFVIEDQTEENLRVTFDRNRKAYVDKKEFDEKYLINGVPNYKDFEEYFIEEGNKSIKNNFKDWVVLCFSEINDDILMWSHYSDGHRGFCLKFDTSYPPFFLI